MVLNNKRHLVARFLDKPIDFCIKHKITPNQISVAGFLVSSLAAACFAFPHIFLYTLWFGWLHLAWVPPVLFLFSGYLDLLDGSLARKTGSTSKFGGFLDSTLDRISDAVIIIGLMAGGMLWPNQQINILIAFIALSVSIMISYTRSRAELEGVIMKGIGIMERAERLIALWVAYIIEASIFFWWSLFPIFPERFIWFFPIFFLVFTILCIQTLMARIIWTYKWLNNKMPEKVAELLAAQQKPAPAPEKEETK
jgi:archaetidylinositol phosphate synthase